MFSVEPYRGKSKWEMDFDESDGFGGHSVLFLINITIYGMMEPCDITFVIFGSLD